MTCLHYGKRESVLVYQMIKKEQILYQNLSYVTRPAKRALMGCDVIMQKMTSEKNSNFEQVPVEIL